MSIDGHDDFGAVTYFSSCFWHIYFEYFFFHFSCIHARRLLYPIYKAHRTFYWYFFLLLFCSAASHMAHMNLLPSFSMCFLQANQEYAFSHHIPNDRQHKFFNFIGRNSFYFYCSYIFFLSSLYFYQEMHRKLITFWIPSKYWS